MAVLAVLALVFPAAAFEPGPGLFEPGAVIYRPPPPGQAPDPADIIRNCREKMFVDCFRQWQPPPPPEPMEPQAQSGIPELPVVGDGTIPPVSLPSGVHPEDKATYEALVKAIGKLGLQDRLMLGPMPADGGEVPMTVNGKAPDSKVRRPDRKPKP